MIEQRTDEWYLQRKGKLTASEIYLLMQKPRDKRSEFSQSCMTWIDKKVAEMFTPDEQFLDDIYNRPVSDAMQWGIDNEVTARMRYLREMKTIGHQVRFTEAGYIRYNEYAGGSPDGYVDGGIVEIKCPTKPTQLRYVAYSGSKDIADDNPQYYAQMQMNMMCARKDGGECGFCDFISYNPTMYREVQLRVIRVPYDAEYCEKLKGRITEAISTIRIKMSILKSKKELITLL